jgi:hypothetical protein
VGGVDTIYQLRRPGEFESRFNRRLDLAAMISTLGRAVIGAKPAPHFWLKIANYGALSGTKFRSPSRDRSHPDWHEGRRELCECRTVWFIVGVFLSQQLRLNELWTIFASATIGNLGR